MCRLCAILILILCTGCAGTEGATVVPTQTATADHTTELTDEFKHLREIEGHFSGGTWNDDVDQWMGRKHVVMIELGDRLGTGSHSRSQAIDLLGAPDAIAREGDPLYDLIRDRGEFTAPSGGTAERLVYHWRGEHDFLYLIVQEETVLGAGWWHAGE